jgi:hypothetical protein
MTLSVPDGWDPGVGGSSEGMAEKCQDLHPDLAAKYRGQAGRSVVLGDSRDYSI